MTSMPAPYPREPVPHSDGTFQTEGRGIVDANGPGFYVLRTSDEELFQRLKRHQPCYVLAPRQIGKSSLRIRTQNRLREADIRCVSVDLTSIGSDASPDAFYFSIGAAIAEELSVSDELDESWKKNRRMSAVRRFRQFLYDVVLGHDTASPVVVFIDEIDVTLSLPFSRDDFFGLVRSTQEERALDPRWKQLTFCLIGVAAPLDLVANPERTPFNNSFAIRIDDFTREEALTFLPGLTDSSDDPESLLDAVLHWTAGHPALTQRLCYRLTKETDDEKQKSAKERVNTLVHRIFLSAGRINDPILLDTERRFAGDRPDARVPVMLHLYQRLLAGEQVVVDGNNPRQFGLRIAGLAAERQDDNGAWLRVRNNIFAEVFNQTWVDEKLARRFLTEPLQIWKDSGRKDDYVLRGRALEIALTWAKGRDDITVDEREFIEASQAVSQHEQQERQQAEIDRIQRERAEQQVLAQRRKVTMLAISAVLFAVVSMFSIILYTKAEEQRQIQILLREQERRDRELAERQARDERDRKQKQLEVAEQELKSAQAEMQRLMKSTEEARREAEQAIEQAESEKIRAGISTRSALEARRKAIEAEKRAQELTKKQYEAAEALARAEKNVRDAKIAASVVKSVLPSDDVSAIQVLNKTLETTKEDLKKAQHELEELKTTVTQRTQERDTARTDLKKATEKIEQLTKELANQKFATPPPMAPRLNPTNVYEP